MLMISMTGWVEGTKTARGWPNLCAAQDYCDSATGNGHTQSEEILETKLHSKLILWYYVSCISFWLVSLKYQSRCRLETKDERNGRSARLSGGRLNQSWGRMT